jgi:hypothetical protein
MPSGIGSPNLFSVSSEDGSNGYVVGQSGTVIQLTNINNSTIATATNLNPGSTSFGTNDFYFANVGYDYDEMDVFEQAAGAYDLDATSPYNGQYRDKNTLTCNYGVPYNSLPGPGNPSAVGGTYPISDFSQWHVYGIEWSPSTVTYYIDNQISRIIPNPGYQPGSNNGNSLSQPAFIYLNMAVSGFVKWNDTQYPDCSGLSHNCRNETTSADWPGRNCPSYVCSSSLVANAPALYDPNYSTPASPYDYWKYFDPTTAGGPPGGYAGYPATSMNTTSFNTSATPVMLIDHVGYWKLNNGTPGSGSCWTGAPTYTTLTQLNGYPNQPQNTITITPASGNIITNSSSPSVIRASNYIEINGNSNGSFSTSSGTPLLLDISACY